MGFATYILHSLENVNKFPFYSLISNMNIGVDLRCLQTPFRTGVGEYAFEFLTAILKIDHQNQYYLFYNSFEENLLPKFNLPNVTEFKSNCPNKLFNLSSLLFGSPKIDLLIKKKFNLTKLDYFFSPHLNFISLSSEVKHLLTIHDLTFEMLPNFLTKKQLLWHRLTKPKKQCLNAHTIFTPSENTRRDLVSVYGIDQKKITTIYPGISSIFASALPENEIKLKYHLPDKFILFLGTLEPRKNIIALVKAFEVAAPSLPESYHLVIAGAPGWKNHKLLKTIKNSLLRKRIQLIGYVAENDKPNFYRSAELFVYPSFYEGFGFPVLEAMASGVPVATSNRSSLPEITAGAAYLFNPHRINEIADGIVKILTDKNLKNNLIISGKKRAEQYSWDIAAKKWLELISKV